MADEEALVVRLEATQARFERDMRKAEGAFNRSAGAIENRANRLDQRLGQVGNRLSQGVERAVKSARSSASAFEGFDRAAAAFRNLEGSLDPAVRALHQYERAQEVVAEAVRRGAVSQEQATAVMQRAQSQYAASLAPLGRAAGASRGFGMAVQQAGFQVGDFAVQVASGGGVLRPFIQQGTQLISMFGPWGAVIGAAGAVVGALAVTLFDATDATDSLADAQSALESTGSRITDLNRRIEESSGAVREALIAERDATIDLLKARLALAKESLANRVSNVRAEAAREVRLERESGAFGSEVLEGLENALPNDPRVVDRRVDQFIDDNPELKVEIRSLQSQIAETEAQLEGLANPTQTPAESRRSGGGGGGGAGRGRPPADAVAREVEGIRERIDLLHQERALIEARAEALARGASPEQVARGQEVLTAAFERQRVVEELLNKAREEGLSLTPEQIAQVQQLAADTEALTIANFDLEAATDAQARAAEDAQRRQEDLARAVSDVADRMLGAIQQAESFKDALAAIGIELLRLSVQGLGGQGPLGKVLGGVIGGLFGAGAGGGSALSVGPGTGGIYATGAAFSSGREITPFARGGVVDAPTLFPMARGMGLMGEAGPEAVMPLRRGPGGRLGVEATGGGVTVVNNNHFEGVNHATRAMLEGMIRDSEARTLQAIPGVASAGFSRRPGLRGPR